MIKSVHLKFFLSLTCYFFIPNNAFATTTEIQKPKIENSFSIGADFSFFTADQLRENIISIDGRYGWLMEKFEFGPIVQLDFIDEGAGYNTSYRLGGYVDYRLNDFDEPSLLIPPVAYGLTAQGFSENLEFTSGANSQIFGLGAGGFLSWSLAEASSGFGSSTALRTEVLLSHKKITTSSQSTQAYGLGGKILLVFYYH